MSSALVPVVHLPQGTEHVTCIHVPVRLLTPVLMVHRYTIGNNRYVQQNYPWRAPSYRGKSLLSTGHQGMSVYVCECVRV